MGGTVVVVVVVVFCSVSSPGPCARSNQIL